jgi:murein peptide amidase A
MAPLPSDSFRPRPQRGTVPFEPVTYGRSVQQRALEAWLPEGKPELLVLAGIHGEEPETTVLLSSALRSIEPAALRCAVVLAANPDGLARGTRGNAAGVELNRNFPSADWSAELAAHHFTRGEPQDVTLSPGSGPASEPETLGLMALVGELEPRACVAVHSPLACVIDPEGGPLARWLAGETGLELRRSVDTPTPGTLDTWLHEATGAAAVTLELPVISKDEALVRFLPTLALLLTARLDELG